MKKTVKSADKFISKSVKELQEFLMIRGIQYSQLRKADLVQLCEFAETLNVEVDPDGLLEDRGEVLSEKLNFGTFSLISPARRPCSADLSSVPEITILDIYNYLITFDEYDHSALRRFEKMEGYTMYKDGYILGLGSVKYPNGYIAIKTQAKPRTCDKDPVSKKGYYDCWIMMENITAAGIIKSAYCTCKGGIDGCCRHVVATLFEVMNFMEDSKTTSCTSGPCQWVRRPSELLKLCEPVLVSDLENTIIPSDKVVPKPTNFLPVPANQLPDPREFLEKLRTVAPDAVVLETVFKRQKTIAKKSDLKAELPMKKLAKFVEDHKCSDNMCICGFHFIPHLSYDEEERRNIEISTRGQSENNNWFLMREGLITASKFKKVCSSTNYEKTAMNFFSNALDPDNLPAAMEFGVRYEARARNIFMNTHKFLHKNCSLTVPGLFVSQKPEYSFLGCSPDGIIDCRECGKSLIEVKCIPKYKNFHPRSAAKLMGFLTEDNGVYQIKESHPYYYQVQGQMGVCGIKKCFLIFHTHKGIFPIETRFNSIFWDTCQDKMQDFYVRYFYKLLVNKLE